MKINELEDLLGVSKATIRYYEDQGLVIPPRTDNGYREYSDEEVQRITATVNTAMKKCSCSRRS